MLLVSGNLRNFDILRRILNDLLWIIHSGVRLRNGIVILSIRVVLLGGVVPVGRQIPLGRFLDSESSKVVDDELDMLDWSAGLGEVLGNLDVAEAADKVIAIGDGRIDML
ncbi:MAG: hypothetical protein LBS22_04460, partial [Puniceicoccales bacterium]|nr:hypothetical protein [Puniceicoccales bacterium]